jgi:integrase
MGQRNGKLTVRMIAQLTAKGRYGDGRGLYLQVVPKNDKLIRSWIFRYQRGATERVMGFGPLDDVSLDQARELAGQQRNLLRQGIDPVTARDAKRAERVAKAVADEAKSKTFKQVAELYYRQHSPKWKNAKHSQQFLSTLEAYAYPVIGKLRVADVNRDTVLKILMRDDFWQRKTETASRVRGRIESVLDFARVNHWRAEGENPARWSGNLEHALPARNLIAKVEHHAALPYVELPAFIVDLRQREGVAAQALEFTILTAARTGETITAEWSEIDIDNKVWTRPAAHMKAKREHRVPLSDRAVEILQSLPREEGNPHVFIGPQKGSGLSNMAMAQLLKRMSRTDITVHGFRSTFRDWAAETTGYANHVLELALAHEIGNKVEAAYRRGELFEKRTRLMADWAKYGWTKTDAGAAVMPLRGDHER